MERLHVADERPKLRAKRRPPPPRLIEHGGDGGGPTPDLDLPGSKRAAPLTMLRLGGADLGPASRAFATGARPSAIVTGLAEHRETTIRARRTSREYGIPWFADPLLFRTGLDGYRTARNLQTLDYTPGRDSAPFTPEEFDDRELELRVGRGVVGVQGDLGASGALGGAFVIDGPADPWLPVSQRLFGVSADRAAADRLPLLAVLPIRLAGFESRSAQQALVRAFSAKVPAGWYLLADGLSEDSSAERILAALELTSRFRASGTPVLLGRAGDLRGLLWALGIGTEVGLGRLLRFSVPDFTKLSRGPGALGGPRIETPSLCCSLPFQKARRLIDAEVVAEVSCDCPACRRSHTPLASSAEVAEHDAHVVLSGAADLIGLDVADRIDALDARLERAIREWRAIDLAGFELGRPRRLERQREVLSLVVERGIHKPANLMADLRLIE